MAEEDEYIERELPQEKADLIVSGTDLYWPVVHEGPQDGCPGALSWILCELDLSA
jgi:hypothetical protein